LGVENPIKEESLMTGKLEPTNSPYSMAKLTAVELGKSLKEEKGHNVINLMPTNLYGPNDHFEEMNSHVIPGLIYKMHQAVTNNHKEVEIWGSGKPLREFMHVDDLASAIVFLLNKKFDYEVLNIGTGEEVSIKELAEEIKEVCNFKGKLKFNSNLPDGNPRKLLDSTKMNNLGWSHKISLKDGLKSTYEWYIKNI
jgi:GDP-L-fucose synthase